MRGHHNDNRFGGKVAYALSAWDKSVRNAEKNGGHYTDKAYALLCAYNRGIKNGQLFVYYFLTPDGHLQPKLMEDAYSLDELIKLGRKENLNFLLGLRLEESFSDQMEKIGLNPYSLDSWEALVVSPCNLAEPTGEVIICAQTRLRWMASNLAYANQQPA